MNRRMALMAAQGGGGGGGDTENFVRINSPNIVDKVLTTGSAGLIRTPNVFNPGSSSWKIRVGFVSSGSGSQWRDLFGSVASDGTSERGVLVETNNASALKHAYLYASSGGGSWNISGKCDISYYNDISYVYELEFTGTQYRARISSDGGETFGNWSTVTSSVQIPGTYYIGFGLYRSGYWAGTIDLSKCAIWINDVLWWTAYT